MPRSGDTEPTLEGSDFDYVSYYLHFLNCNFLQSKRLKYVSPQSRQPKIPHKEIHNRTKLE